MKRRKRAVIISSAALFIAIILLAAFATGIFSTDRQPWGQRSGGKDGYIFPITPQDTPEEWRKLKSHQEMVDITQIPEDILETMSTRGLIETCLRYPMLGNMFAYSSYPQGLDVLHRQFNGLRELRGRADAADELLAYYISIDYEELVHSDDPFFTLKIMFLDFYMSQDHILLNLDKDERAQLLDVCRETIELKTSRYPEIFSTHSTLYLMERIAEIENAHEG